MDLVKIYNQFDGDLQGTLDRLGGSSALLEKLLVKYLDDKAMSDLCLAMENKDCENAFRAVHTMKGTALNLGFSELAKVSSELTEILRAGDLENSFDKYLDTKKAYEKVVCAIKNDGN